VRVLDVSALYEGGNASFKRWVISPEPVSFLPQLPTSGLLELQPPFAVYLSHPICILSYKRSCMSLVRISSTRNDFSCDSTVGNR